jgi:hypothetical protein
MKEKCKRCGREVRTIYRLDTMCIACAYGENHAFIVEPLTLDNMRDLNDNFIYKKNPNTEIGIAYLESTWHYKTYQPFETLEEAQEILDDIKYGIEYLPDKCYVCYWNKETQQLVSLHGEIPPVIESPVAEIMIKPRKEVVLPPFPFISDDMLPLSIRSMDMQINLDDDKGIESEDWDPYDDRYWDTDGGEWASSC